MSDQQYQIIVKFGAGIKSYVQGPVMLAMEKSLREQGIPAEVLKDTMPDDSKLRSKMTVAERGKL
jgi:hypothetical protein